VKLSKTITAIGKDFSQLQQILIADSAGHLRLKAAFESQTSFSTQGDAADESIRMLCNIIDC
jgi:hypothetical protein